jgi:hypothetical protein
VSTCGECAKWKPDHKYLHSDGLVWCERDQCRPIVKSVNSGACPVFEAAQETKPYVPAECVAKAWADTDHPPKGCEGCFRMMTAKGQSVGAEVMA